MDRIVAVLQTRTSLLMLLLGVLLGKPLDGASVTSPANTADPSLSVLVPGWRERDAAIASIASTVSLAHAKALAEQWVNDKNPRLRAAGVRLGARVAFIQMLPVLDAISHDKQVVVRQAVVDVLSSFPFVNDKDPQSHRVLEIMTVLLNDADVRVKLAALARIAQYQHSITASSLLLQCCQNAPEEVVDQATDALIQRQVPRLLEMLASHLDDRIPQNRVLAANALRKISGARTVKILIGALSGDEGQRFWEARAAICDALSELAPREPPLVALCEHALVPLMQDPKWGVRCAATWALARMGSTAVPAALLTGVDPVQSEPFHSILHGMTAQPWTDLQDWQIWWTKAHKNYQLAPIPAPPVSSPMSFMSIYDTTTNVVFVIDKSGSMAETGLISAYHQKDKDPKSKLDMAKAELLKTAVSLNPGTRINVVFFSGNVETWNNGPLHATWRVKGRLKEFLEGMGPGGATATLEALSDGLDQWGVETMFFLTDGLPTAGECDADKIVQAVCDQNAGLPRKAKIHAIAFFIQEAQAFLTKLTNKNDGTYRLQQ